MRRDRMIPTIAGALSLLALVVWAGGCKVTTTSNTSLNSNSNANTNANSNISETNANTSETAGAGINAREPEKYSATLVFSIETTGGDKAVGIPSLNLQVARSGDDRRLEFKLPDGSPLIYVDHENHHYVVLPNRKQYAELTQESTGVQIHKLLTPGQLVEDLKKINGIQRAGDETIGGRAAEKNQRAKTGQPDRTHARTQKGPQIFQLPGEGERAVPPDPERATGPTAPGGGLGAR